MPQFEERNSLIYSLKIQIGPLQPSSLLGTSIPLVQTQNKVIHPWAVPQILVFSEVVAIFREFVDGLFRPTLYI
jgi:hypothetical protein